MGIVAMVCWICGLAGTVWIALIAFQDDEAVWGVLSLLCAIVAIVYGVQNLDRAKIPLILMLVGIVGNVILLVAMHSAG